MAVSLTEAAARHVTRYLAKRGKGVGVRLGVKTTGCSGLAYKLEYVDDVAPEDVVFENHGVKLLIDPKSLAYIDGTELDFVRDGLNEGFRFNNPKSGIARLRRIFRASVPPVNLQSSDFDPFGLRNASAGPAAIAARWKALHARPPVQARARRRAQRPLCRSVRIKALPALSPLSRRLPVRLRARDRSRTTRHAPLVPGGAD